MPRCLVAFLIGLVSLGIATGATAQTAPPYEIDVEGVSLEAALELVRSQADLDLVYAERLVDDRTTSCLYRGPSRRALLECVLQGTGVQAERVRRRQFVLVPPTTSPDTSATARVSLTGHVVDAETGERLPNAHVYLTNLQAGTTTNQDGYFVVSSLPPRSYQVHVSYLGYQAVDTTLAAGQGSAEIALDPTPLKSEGVTVEAGTTGADEHTRLPGMMTVALDRLDRLPSFGEPDLFKALQWTPGIRKSGIIGGGLSVRGGDPDQNLYLLDGAPVYHPWHAFSLISTFQTGTLQATNLYRGGFPPEHGSRLSAILDAQMKDGERRQPSAEAALSVLSGRFRIEAPLSSSTSFMLSGRRSYVDKLLGRQHPVTDASGQQDTLRTGYYFYDTSAKLSHRFSDNHRVSVSYYHGQDDLDLRLPFDLSLDFSSWLRPADLFFEVVQNWDNRVLSAQHQYLATDDVFITSTVYGSGYRAQEASFVQPTSTASLRSDYRVRLRDTGLKVDVDYHHSVSHEFQAGIEVSTLQFESDLESNLRRTQSTNSRQSQSSRLGAVEAAGYVQDVWTPMPEWTLQPGVRASYFSNGKHFHLAPRLSARYAAHPRWLVLKGSAGMHVQYLHRLRDRYSLAYDLVSSRWIPSSSRVAPATGIQLGFGMKSQPHARWTVELDTYARGGRDLLVPADAFQQKDALEGPGIEVGALLGQYTEGEERAFGAEVSTVYEWKDWTLRAGLGSGRTFVRVPERSGGRWRPADLDVPYSFRGAVSWSRGAWSSSVATVVRSGYPISEPVARYRLGDPVEEEPVTYLYRPQVNNGRLAPYFRVDLTLGYQFRLLSANWAATLNVFNATNRGNVVDQTYRPTESGVDIERQRGLPLLPLLELEMTL